MDAATEREGQIDRAVRRRYTVVRDLAATEEQQRAGLAGVGSDGVVLRVRVPGDTVSIRALKLATPNTLSYLQLAQEQELHWYLRTHTGPNGPVLTVFDFWHVSEINAGDTLAAFDADTTVRTGVARRIPLDRRVDLFGTEMALVDSSLDEMLRVPAYNHRGGEFPDELVFSVAQLVAGLAVLAPAGFMHGDMHPGNARLVMVKFAVEGFSYRVGDNEWWNVPVAKLFAPGARAKTTIPSWHTVLADFGRSTVRYADDATRREYGDSVNSFVWLWNDSPEFPTAEVRQFIGPNVGYDMWIFALFLIRTLAQLPQYSPVLHHIVLALIPDQNRVLRFQARVAAVNNRAAALLSSALRVLEIVRGAQLTQNAVRSQLATFLVDDDAKRTYLLRIPWMADAFATTDEVLTRLSESYERLALRHAPRRVIRKTTTPEFPDTATQWMT